jgi:hypothetical protein
LHVFSFLFLIIVCGPFSVTSVYVCVPLESITLSHRHIHIVARARVCVRHFSVVLMHSV